MMRDRMFPMHPENLPEGKGMCVYEGAAPPREGWTHTFHLIVRPETVVCAAGKRRIDPLQPLVASAHIMCARLI